ncbi:MAG: AhpC/TSA family protein [Chitinophagaceae bacterium]|nr:AhpC/TSA family protein [Chitinophagaceae bacterium]
MKKLFLLALVSQPLWLQAQQKGFDIHGKAGNENAPGKIYLYYTTPFGSTADSVRMVDGIFSFKGSVFEPMAATLILDHAGVGLEQLNTNNADFLNLYLDNESVTITSKDSIKKATITGSAINDELARYNAFINGRLTKTAEGQNADEGIAALKAYIVQNPTSYFALVALTNLLQVKVNPETVDSLYKMIPPVLQNMEAGKRVAQGIATLRATTIGAMARPFMQPDTAGNPVQLADFKGKYILLDFWASWCKPCRVENPRVLEAYKKYHPKGLEILGVSLDDANGKNAWLTAIKQDGLLWTQVSDLKGGANDAAVLYGVRTIPQNFLIDPQGRIIATGLRGQDLENKLAEVFH